MSKDMLISKLLDIHGQNAQIERHQPTNALVDEIKVVDSEKREFFYVIPDTVVIPAGMTQEELLDIILLTGGQRL